MSKKAVMACIHYWGSPYQVATHHIARRLAAAGWDVAYLSAPITPLHLLKLKDDKVSDRMRLCRKGPTSETIGAGRLTSYIPFSLLGPDNRAPLNSAHVVDHWPAYSLGSIRRFLVREDFEQVDLAYFDNFYHTALLPLLDARHRVYHMADNYSAFPGYSAAFRSIEERLVQQVDTVFYPSRDMEGYVDSFRPRHKHFLPNGVDFEYFSRPGNPPPAEYADIPAPRALYVGAIEQWFDFDLVEKTARAHPDISLVLIGGDRLARERLPDLPNIHLLGSRPREVLPAYLEHAQAGIIPFNVRDFPDLLHPVRPLKLLEYLSAGLPALSVAWRELATMDSPARLAHSADEFVDALPAICAAATDSEREAARNYARQYDWDTLFEDFSRQLVLKELAP